MLSQFRFHRRAPSNPTSPLPEQAPGLDATVAQRDHPQQQPPRDVSPRPDARPRSPNSSQLPPTLPPITRVASTSSGHFFTPHHDAPPPPQDARQPPARAGYSEDKKAGFIGGAALQDYRQAARVPQSSQASQGPSGGMTMAGHVPVNQLSRAKPPPPPINTGASARQTAPGNKHTKSSWFSTPTDLQGPGGTGKRPGGTRLTTEPALVPAPEPQKGRRGLPFLKNPVSSLLMRRKTAHSAVETQPPAPIYDPRIKGTRVHDFSAPRPKKTASGDAVSTTKQEAISPVASPAGRGDDGTPSFADGPTVCSPEEAAQGAIDSPKHNQNGDSQLVPEGRRPSSSTVRPGQTSSVAPPNDGSSLYTSSSGASSKTQTATRPPTTSTSVKTTASRQLSKSDMSRGNSVASAVPKHMKSTSSRFSFDMIGAADQERELEERHRQREQDIKKTSGEPTDPRFDDFDEDFDYDAMLDDDGLEERIPGINADYDYDDYGDGADLDDPDNDQENFAGFTFQRSNPVSSLTSPHTPGMVATPRDAAGNVIGFATTKDLTPTTESPMFPGPQHFSKQDDDLDAPDQSVYQPNNPPAATAQQPPLRPEHDDIYFDDGLADELDFEHDGTVFDESIFDNNDTDQYGRPIPGAFAQAKEAMQSAHQQQQQQQQDDKGVEAEQQQPPSCKADLASIPPSQPGVAEAKDRISPSISAQQPPVQEVDQEIPPPQDCPEPEADPQGQDLAYQAALAAAAQIAAASGKFARSASPEAPTGLVDEPLDELAGYEDDEINGYINDYAVDDFGGGFGDSDFDDEAIIAEANASALANDDDGFYGQEFNFYANPLTHQPHNSNHYQPSTATTTSGTSSGVLTSENLFQYANGGFFGPASAGLDRNTSGRVVREPNLTPITERSEYSNRNSVMSFTLPPAIGSGGSERNSMTSPGLAQLALLPPDADDLNLGMSALMKLRSRAWGGSQPSLVSSREGSPRSERASLPAAMQPLPPPLDAAGSPYGTVPAHLAGHVRVNSGLSLWSSSEVPEEEGGRPAAAAANAGGVVGNPVHASVALAMGMSSLRGQGLGLGHGVILPPRPGSAGAVVNGGGGGSNTSNGGNGTNGMVVPPLPQRPHSLFLPPSQSPLSVPLPAAQPVAAAAMPVGGTACSPVLEGEEVDAEGASAAATAADGFVLAPALPLRAGNGEW